MSRIKIKIKQKKLIILSLVLFLISAFIYFQFRPIIKSIASSRARVIATETVNEAILQELSENKDDYENIVKIQKNDSGELTVLLSDMEKINKLKSRVGLIIQNKFSGLKEGKIKIPIGTLTGIEIFSGIGPGVPLKISITGNVSTEFESNFKDAGINQTIYQIYLRIQTRMNAVIPGCCCSDNFETSILISETIILGTVPKVYSNNNL